MPFHVHQRATRRRHAEHGGTGPLSANKFEPQDATALAAELVGTVVLATDDAYEASRHGFFRARRGVPPDHLFLRSAPGRPATVWPSPGSTDSPPCAAREATAPPSTR